MQPTQIVIDNIRQHGPLSFRDFMETALYHPVCGYYCSSTERIGTTGDYLTSPEISPVFGALVARQIEELWTLTPESPYTIVEFGGGNGKLCRDILSYLKSNPALYNNLSYFIVEKNHTMRKTQNQPFDPKVTWVDSVDLIPPFSGCVISNELVDNLAVHQVIMQDELMEILVDYTDGVFVERLVPASIPLKDYFSELNISLPKGFRTEVNLDAKKWLREVASLLQSGYVITIDYGGTSSE